MVVDGQLKVRRAVRLDGAGDLTRSVHQDLDAKAATLKHEQSGDLPEGLQSDLENVGYYHVEDETDDDED